MMSGGCCGAKKQKLTSSSNNHYGKAANDCPICSGQNCTNSIPPPPLQQNGPPFYSGSSANGFQNCSSKFTATNSTNNATYCNGMVSCFTSPKADLLGDKSSSLTISGIKFVTQEMVIFCFDVLHSYLHNYEPPKAPRCPNDQFPLFVTWKIGKEKKLRGCIGTFTSTSLHQGLREYAITSAVKDSRFDPITADEFSRLHCYISLLLNFEVADHHLDWQIGLHGIRIEFNNDRGHKKAATYLPEVSVEQGWNHVQTIDSLLRKGGHKGPITHDIRSSVYLVRFQSEKIGLSHSEYVAYKKSSTMPGTIHGYFNSCINSGGLLGGCPSVTTAVQCDQQDSVAGPSRDYCNQNGRNFNGYVKSVAGCSPPKRNNNNNYSSHQYEGPETRSGGDGRYVRGHSYRSHQ